MVREVLEVINDLLRGRTMILVTHEEMQFAQAIADRIIFLDQGPEILWRGDAPLFLLPILKQKERKIFKRIWLAIWNHIYKGDDYEAN